MQNNRGSKPPLRTSLKRDARLAENDTSIVEGDGNSGTALLAAKKAAKKAKKTTKKAAAKKRTHRPRDYGGIVKKKAKRLGA